MNKLYVVPFKSIFLAKFCKGMLNISPKTISVTAYIHWRLTKRAIQTVSNIYAKSYIHRITPQGRKGTYLLRYKGTNWCWKRIIITGKGNPEDRINLKLPQDWLVISSTKSTGVYCIFVKVADRLTTTRIGAIDTLASKKEMANL